MKLLSVETFLLGVNNVVLHKLRSLLTSLGIIFGVAAVISMLSISEGASADEMRMIELLGTSNIIVSSVKPMQTSNVAQGNTRILEYGITDEDLSIVAETVPNVTRIVPLKAVSHRVSVGERQMPATVLGTTPGFFQTVNIEIGAGRVFSGPDSEARTAVCVLGHKVREELFPLTDPIGETILVARRPNAIPFTVIGVLRRIKTAGAPARGVEERDLNREVLIPLATARALFGDLTVRRQSGTREITKVPYSGLYVTVDAVENVMAVSEVVRRVFDFKHTQLDYDIRVPLRALELAKQKKRNSQYLLGFIAGISLLVGGIGIMNIMLATVTERTREIGIRRALGARKRHITVQFLVETTVLSTAGGVVGVVLGVVGAHLVNALADWQTIVSLWSVAISFGLSVVAGISFGMYPAISAARLDPIEALRHE